MIDYKAQLKISYLFPKPSLVVGGRVFRVAKKRIFAHSLNVNYRIKAEHSPYMIPYEFTVDAYRKYPACYIGFLDGTCQKLAIEKRIKIDSSLNFNMVLGSEFPRFFKIEDTKKLNSYNNCEKLLDYTRIQIHKDFAKTVSDTLYSFTLRNPEVVPDIFNQMFKYISEFYLQQTKKYELKNCENKEAS